MISGMAGPISLLALGILFQFLIFLNVVAGNSIPPSETTINCTLLSRLPCTATYENVDCPLMPPYDTTDTPGPPSSVSASEPQRIDQDVYNVTISWRLPDYSYLKIKGFALSTHRISQPVGPIGCVWFDLENAMWEDKDNIDPNITYNYTFSLAGGSEISYTLKSLPQNEYKRNTFRGQFIISGDTEHADWTTNITVEETSDESVSFSFDLAPRSYGFEVYHVMLCNTTSETEKDCFGWKEYRVAEDNISGRGTYTFQTALSPGSYEIQVRPAKEKTIEGKTIKLCPIDGYNECMTSKETFNISGEAVHSPVIENPRSKQYGLYIGIVAGFVALTMVVVLLLKLVSYFVPCWPGKKVIIIASSYDTKAHQHVLKELETYLESLGCYVRVFFGPSRPTPQQLQNADDVLMMCCNIEIQKQVMAIDNEEHGFTEFKDAFLQTYAHIKSQKITSDEGKTKFCLLYFPYMPYPETAHQLPKIQDHELTELEKFIFADPEDEEGDSLDVKKSVRKRLEDPARFNRIDLAIKAAQNQREPESVAAPFEHVDRDDIDRRNGPVSTVSWVSRPPTEDAASDCSTSSTAVISTPEDGREYDHSNNFSTPPAIA